MAWGKKGLFILLMLFSVIQTTAYIIDGSDVFINDSNVYMKVSPHTVVEDGCAVVDFQSKHFTGDVNLVLGVDTNDMRPRSLSYWNPHNVTTQESYACDQPGMFYNYTLIPKVFYCWQNGSVNGTNNTLLFSHAFDSANSTTKTAYWSVTSENMWSAMEWKGQTINFNFDDKNKWFIGTGYHVTSLADGGGNYRIQICFSTTPTRLGEKPKTFKYDFGLFPNFYGENLTAIQAANQAGHLYYIDPWTQGTTGLITYWNLDEASGTAIVDSMGLHNATTSGSPPVNTTGLIGNGRTITGASQCWTTDKGLLGGVNTFSVSWWEKIPSTLANGACVMDHRRDNNGVYFDYSGGNNSYMKWGGVIITYRSPVYNSATFHHYVWTSNKTNDWYYIDGVLVNSSSHVARADMANDGTTFYWNGYNCGTNGRVGSTFDEIAFFNRLLSADEASALYNSGSGLPFPFYSGPTVTFVSQSPADINSSNLIASYLNISYEVNSSGLDNASVYLHYKTNTSTSACVLFLNGSCYSGNNLYFSLAASQVPALNTTSALVNWSGIISEKEVYPATYNLGPVTVEQTAHDANDLGPSTSYAWIGLLNVSNESVYGFFEIMAANLTGTGSLRLYYCNSSYATGNPSTSTNCYNFNTLNPGAYNHQHSENSSHQVASFSVVAGKVGTVQVTPNSTFIIRGVTPHTQSWNYYTVNISTRATNVYKTTGNSGVSWTDLSGTQTVDAHLHQFTGSDIFCYYATANDSIPLNGSSTESCDNLDLTLFPPSAPSVLVPNASIYRNTDLININYTASVSPNGFDIAYYNITLLNYDFSINSTIIENNSNNLNYTWNISAIGYGQYHVGVVAYDNNSQASNRGISELFTINTAPTFNETIPNIIINHNTALSVQVNCSENDDADSLTYGLNDSEIVTISSTTGLMTNKTWTASTSANYSFTIYCNDTYESVNQTFWIDITNTAPVVENLTPTITVQSLTTTTPLGCEASDADGDSLTYTYYYGVIIPNTTYASGAGTSISFLFPASLTAYYFGCSANDGQLESNQLNSTITLTYISLAATSTGSTIDTTNLKPIISYDDVVREEIKERNLNILQALIFRVRAWLGLENLD